MTGIASLPNLRVYESAKTRHCMASLETFSKLDILELRDRENDDPSFLSAIKQNFI